MQSYSKRNSAVKDKRSTNAVSAQRDGNQSKPQFVDNRAETVAQRQLVNAINSSPKQVAQRQPYGDAAQLQSAGEKELQMKAVSGVVQRAAPEEEELMQGKFDTAQRVEDEELLQGKFETAQRVEDEELLQGKFSTESVQQKSEALPNNTGLPDNLKAGIENLSGYSMDDVKVHYNSDKPSQLQAHAYAQGTDIHIASGQERHLPHEAWHLVQQKQGRVRPTSQAGGIAINDDKALENEADVMGGCALQMKYRAPMSLHAESMQFVTQAMAQLMPSKDADFVKGLFPTFYSVADGKRLGAWAAKLGTLYNTLGTGEVGEYLNQPIDTGEFATFEAGSQDYAVKGQKNKRTGERPGLEKGNYFHIHNRNKDKTIEKKGTARRIIVNVKTQKDAFALSNGLLELFDRSSPSSPYIREFKVYLSNARKAKIKKDKIVVYYSFNMKDESADLVGDAIVAKIESLAEENALVDDFAPFYERVSKGIAWAEEPKYHSKLQGSFTSTRVDVIKSVIKSNATVVSAEALLKLVEAAFNAAHIDVDSPARHTPE